VPKKSAEQPELFDLPPPPLDPVAMVRVDIDADQLGPSQRAFNRLTAQIRRDRQRLADWEAFRERFRQRLAAELDPLLQQLLGVQRRMAWRIDALLDGALPGPRPTRRERDRLLQLLDELLAMLLDRPASPGEAVPPEPELEAMRIRHFGRGPFDFDDDDDPGDDGIADDPEDAAAALEDAECLYAGLFGEEAIRGHAARNIEELRAHVERHLEARERHAREKRQAKTDARRARRGTPSREEQAGRLADAGLSLREVYRRLVSSLHPDRETDPGERTRKTALMQRANQAYERKDLLELLALQIEIEQIDADHLSTLPEQRLAHYNEILREQSKQLQMQISRMLADVRNVLDSSTVRDPATADVAFGRRLRETERVRQELEQDLRDLDDPKRRRALLDRLPEVDDDGFSELDLELLAGVLSAASPRVRSAPATPRGGNARKGRKGKKGRKKR